MVFVNTNVVSRTDFTFISYFWMHWKGITGKEVEMAKETRKENQKEISKAKTGRNHEILGMLKAGVSARQISPEYNLSYSGAKKLCAKLKLMEVVGTVLVLDENVKPLSEVIVSLSNIQKQVRRQKRDR